MKQLLHRRFSFLILLMFILFGGSIFAQTAQNSFTEDFNGDLDTAFWSNNWAGGLIAGDRDENTFKYTTNALNNYYLGVILQFVNKDVVLDLKENPYISFRAKAENAIIAAENADSIPIGMDLINLAGDNIGLFYTKAVISADGEWYDCAFDFSEIADKPGMDSIAKIRFNPGKDRFDGYVVYSGSVWIDDFKAGEAAKPVIPPTVKTSYYEDFSTVVDTTLWLGNTGSKDDGTPIFTLVQEDGALSYTIDQQNFYDGQHYKFTDVENVIFDLTDNGYMTVKLNVAPGATYNDEVVDSVLFLASPWGQDSTGTLVREVDSPKFLVPADGEWHEYTFDFTANIGRPLWNGVIPPGDLSRIEKIVFESVIYGGTYKFNFKLDDFTLGEAAVPTEVLTSYENDFSKPANLDLWLGNTGKRTDGSPIFTVDQADGALSYTVDQNAFYDGQHFRFKKFDHVVFDLTENGLMTVKLNIESGATYDGEAVDSVWFLASPWGRDSTNTFVREVDSPKFLVPADGEWHEYTFDFAANIGKPLWNGVIPPGDLSKIEKILLEAVVYPGVYKFNYKMDDFRLGEAAIVPEVLTSYENDFSKPVDLDLWLGNTGAKDDGTPIFTVVQENGALSYTVDQNKFWDGQHYRFRKYDHVVFDLTENGLMSVKLNVEPGATYDGEVVDSVLFLASPWGLDSTNTLVREVDSPTFLVPADGQWHEYTFDFAANVGKPLWNGVIPPGDLSRIEKIVFESVVYAGVYKFNFKMDDFRLGEAAVESEVLTSYENDFSKPVNLDLWLGNTGKKDDGSPIFTVNQAEGALNYTVDQDKFWDGQHYRFRKYDHVVFDLTENGLMSVKLNVEPGATYDGEVVDSVLFLASPWGLDSTNTLVREVDSPNFLVPADGQWHEYTFDFAANVGKPLWNGVIPPGDLSRIEKIVFESVVYAGVYKFNFKMDDFRLGEAAKAPEVLTSYSEDFSDNVDLDLWLGNTGNKDDGTPIFTVDQTDGALSYTVDQNKFWDGQHFRFRKLAHKVFDLTENGLMSVKLNVAPGATYDGEVVDSVWFLASPWGVDSTNTLEREVDSPKFLVPADGEWHEYTFDFAANVGKPLWNGVIPTGDLSRIEKILLESVVYPGVYKFNYKMDDFRLGEAVVGINTVGLVKFDIYPNPVSTDIVIVSEEIINKVEVTNIVGVKLISKNYSNNNSVNLAVSTLPTGSYIVNIYTDKGISSQLMIKK